MLQYPARIEADGDRFMASFRDIPEALTGADTWEQTQKLAAEALLTAMDFYFEDGRAVPPASAPEEGEVLVSLPASVEAKILVLNEMVAQHVTQSELARKMGTTKQEVTRIVDLHHATKIDTLAQALGALGRQLRISVV
ncbi:type II toxin-antitoxin system HicB family antitoxin [Achromobacter piechaudii]|uniref:type II toxin-antitoxin system HicB family antitoxin n=1 Tax=Achromobacter piechaudii TaxID=72556 RepID=UPI003DAA2FB4